MSKKYFIDELKEKIRLALSFSSEIGLAPKASKSRGKGIDITGKCLKHHAYID